MTRIFTYFTDIDFISTHTLTWSVTDKTTLKGVAGKDFNSHAHVERDEDFDFTLNKLKDFNSHAHVERDMCGTNFGSGAKISTHTLTWSVTSVFRLTHGNAQISTHTLTWSVTILALPRHNR